MTRYFRFVPQIEVLDNGPTGTFFTPLMGEVTSNRIYSVYEEGVAYALANHREWKEVTEQEYNTQPPIVVQVGKWYHLPQSLRPIVEHEDIMYGVSSSIGVDVVLGTPPVVTFDSISPDIPEEHETLGHIILDPATVHPNTVAVLSRQEDDLPPEVPDGVEPSYSQDDAEFNKE